MSADSAILVDADACPVKEEVYRVAARYGLRTVIVANQPIMVPRDPLVERVLVPAGLDAADDWIAEAANPATIVVTADVPLADRCVKAGATVIAPTGRLFTASSIGAEAFTIAMVLQDMVAAGARFRFSVLGTDVSGQVIEQARAAIYPAAMVEPVPAAMRQRYLMASRQSEDPLVRIVPELRKLVQFHGLNLMDADYPIDRDVDVIFCRNVLIYFDKPTQAAVTGRLAGHLRPGGYLILGHSESSAGNGVPGLTPVLPTIYQREA